MFEASRTLAVLAFALLICITTAAGAEESGGPDTAAQNSAQNAVLKTVSAGEIVSMISAGEPVDFADVRVLGDIDLSRRGRGAQISQAVSLVNCTFSGRVGFEGATLAEPLDMRESTFEGAVSFQNTRVLGDATFAGARFEDGADFRLAEFDRSAQFGRTVFDYVAFNNTQFKGNVDFTEANFTQPADFDLAQFSRAASFMKTNFESETRFTNAQFDGTTIFMGTDFKGDAWFDGARFENDVLFRSSRFHRGAVFFLANFVGFSDFSGVSFDSGAIFAMTKFSDNAYFIDSSFGRSLILESARIYTMQLDNVTFGNESEILLKDADFSKFIVRWDTIKDRMDYDGAAYLALVKNYKNLEWFDDADDCYYQYRKVGQEMEPWGWAKLIDIISWVSCGYGVRVSYTIFWSVFTIVFFGVLFWAGNGMRKYDFEMLGISGSLDGGGPQKRVSLIDALYFSTAMFTTSQAPVNTYPVGFHRHLAMVEGITGWFLLGLFVVVLSGMLIR